MINALIERATVLQRQAEQLAKELHALRRERDKLQRENEAHNQRLEAMTQNQKSQQQLVDVNAFANALSKDDAVETRKRLSQLVKELDTVIRYLEKS